MYLSRSLVFSKGSVFLLEVKFFVCLFVFKFRAQSCKDDENKSGYFFFPLVSRSNGNWDHSWLPGSML